MQLTLNGEPAHLHRSRCEPKSAPGLLSAIRGDLPIAGAASRRWGWWLFAALALMQYGLFRQHALREVVWAYPPHHDQLGYLMRSYAKVESMRSDGIVAGFWEILAPRD